jgi:hydroxypyruvate reductase
MSAVATVPSQRGDRQERKAVVVGFLRAALRAADPELAVRRALRRDGTQLSVDGKTYDLDRYRKVLAVGGGKAGAAMARALEEVLGDYLTGGIVAVKASYGAPTRKIDILTAAHPTPDERSLAAAQQVAALVDKATEDDLLICLISGGASSLLALPAPGITLADKQQVTDLLLRAGASINELNAVRKHLSAIKGGELARLAFPATLISLILSDVVGNPLDVIASGPTVPDSSTFQEAWDVLTKYNLVDHVSPSIVARLRKGINGAIPETPKPGGPIFATTYSTIIASNEAAASAAAAAAKAQGWHTLLLSTFVEGEAREVGRVFAGIAKELAHSGHPLPRPACIIAGGETTVTVRGIGRGGRNQELTLAAALQLDGWPDIAVAAIATDGGDGPTDAAGAYADGETVRRAKAAGFDPVQVLSNNDSYSLFSALADLIVTGPTHTNVNDLVFTLAF